MIKSIIMSRISLEISPLYNHINHSLFPSVRFFRLHHHTTRLHLMQLLTLLITALACITDITDRAVIYKADVITYYTAN